jgi:hypothetical protein
MMDQDVATADRAPDVGAALERGHRPGRQELILEPREVHRSVELEQISEGGEAGARIEIFGP